MEGGRHSSKKFVKLLPSFFLIITLDLRWEVPGISMMLLTLFLDLMILFDLRFEADVLDIFRSICNHQICKLYKGPGNLELCIAVRSYVITALWGISSIFPLIQHMSFMYTFRFLMLCHCLGLFRGFLSSQTWRASPWLDLSVTARFGCILAANLNGKNFGVSPTH